MIFSSPKFILLFLPIAFLGYFFLNRIRLCPRRQGLAGGGKPFFYAYWNIAYLPLLRRFHTVQLRRRHRSPEIRRQAIPGFRPASSWLAGSSANLGSAWIFQVCRLPDRQHQCRVRCRLYLPHMLLPLGISFFTFTQIAYLVDSYRGEAKGIRFPQLCAVCHLLSRT